MGNKRKKIKKELKAVIDNYSNYLYETSLEESSGDIAKAINRQNELRNRLVEETDLFLDSIFKEKIEKKLEEVEDEDYEILKEKLFDDYLNLTCDERVDALNDEELKEYINYIKELKENYEFDKKEKEMEKWEV